MLLKRLNSLFAWQWDTRVTRYLLSWHFPSSLPKYTARISSLFQPQWLSVRLYLYYNILYYVITLHVLIFWCFTAPVFQRKSYLMISCTWFKIRRILFFPIFGMVRWAFAIFARFMCVSVYRNCVAW